MVAPVKKENKEMSLNVFADYIENCKAYGKEPSWEGLRAYKTMHSKSKKQVRPCMPNKKIVNGINITNNNEIPSPVPNKIKSNIVNIPKINIDLLEFAGIK